ncbi:hypothetical protein B0E43_21155 [Algoriphagus sp. A40]|nr:hypothetical protein B0E43_21155 [Algoriphagus sp. A40]
MVRSYLSDNLTALLVNRLHLGRRLMLRLHKTAFPSPRLAGTREKGKWNEAVAVGSESPFLEWREKSCHLENGTNESERKEWAKRGGNFLVILILKFTTNRKHLKKRDN